MQNTIEYLETTRKWRNYLKISESGHLHVFVPYTIGGHIGISQENTCQGLEAAKRALSNDTQNNIFTELMAFETDCYRIIGEHRSTPYITQRYTTLLEEAKLYADAMRALTTDNRSLNCMVGQAGTQGQYIQAMKSLFEKKNNNVFSIQLNPDTRDSYIKTIAPVFTITRTDTSPVCRHFIRDFQALRLTPRTRLARLRNDIAQACYTQFRQGTLQDMIPSISQALKDSKLFIENPKRTEGVEIKDLINVAQYQPGLDERFNSAEEIGAWIRAIIQKFDIPYQRGAPFEEMDIYANQPDDQNVRAKTLCFLLQFFLAEVSAYARFLQISSENFGTVLERNLSMHMGGSLCTQISTAVKQSFAENYPSEAALLKVINDNTRTFGMLRQFTPDECQQITILFRTHYRSIEGHKEKDEFILHFDRPAGQRSLSFAFGNSMSFHLIDILAQAPYRTSKEFQHEVISSNRNRTAEQAHRAFDALRQSSAIQEDIKRLPSRLSNSERVPRRIKKISLSALRDEIERGLQNTCDASKAVSEKIATLNVLLFQTQDGTYIFNLLGAQFFKKYHHDLGAQQVFQAVLNEFSVSPQVAVQFRQVVLGEEELGLAQSRPYNEFIELDAKALQALYDVAIALDTETLEFLSAYTEDQRRQETLLIILGFRFQTIGYDQNKGKLTIATDGHTKARLSSLSKSIHDTARYNKAALIPGWQQISTIEEIREQCKPPLLPQIPTQDLNNILRNSGSSPFRICLAVASMAIGAALAATSVLICLQNPIVGPLLLLNLPLSVLSTAMILGVAMIAFGYRLFRSERLKSRYDARLFGGTSDIETGMADNMFRAGCSVP